MIRIRFLLGGRVKRRADFQILRAVSSLSAKFGQAKIADFNGILIGYQDVKGFDVPMDDAGMMQAGQSFKGLADVVNGPVGWNDAGWQLDLAGFSHHGPQIVAVIVHGIEIPAVSLVKVPYFQKMRVPQSCHGDGFGNKQRFDPVHAQNIHQKRIRGKKLQRGDFADNRKPDFKDLAHAAPAK